MARPSVCLVSLGCPKNQVDSERILGALQAAGIAYVEDAEAADAVVINTCGFIREAKEEAIATIFEYVALKAERPHLRIAVAGCLLQRYGDELRRALPEVDLWIASAEPDALRPLLRSLGCRRGPRGCDRLRLLNPPGTAYLRVSEGCSNRCSYCAIPAIKGPLRSRDLAAVVREARLLWRRHDLKELVLVAQDVTSYGVDRGESDALYDLLRALLRVPIPWIRLLYTYPLRLSERVIDLMAAEPRICRYLDVPVQHGDARMMKRMGRRGSPQGALRYLERLRERLPRIALRSTVLVGHPGEGPREFRNLQAFVRQARFEWLGAFAYSAEEGTASLRQRPLVPRRTARRRVKAVHAAFLRARRPDAFGVGLVKEALVESVENGVALCRSQTEAPEVDGVILVPVPEGASVRPGSLTAIRLLALEGLDFAGELVY